MKLTRRDEYDSEYDLLVGDAVIELSRDSTGEWTFWGVYLDNGLTLGHRIACTADANAQLERLRNATN